MKTTKIKVMLIDDHSVVRFGIRSLLERDTEIEVCAESGTIREALDILKTQSPDLVILDYKMPDATGDEGCAQIKSILPSTRVIILTAYADDFAVRACLKAGADGFLSKNIDGNAIRSAVFNVYNGTKIFDNDVMRQILMTEPENNLPLTDYPHLSPKEIEILDLISQGKTNRSIASQLFISEKTVRNYVSAVMKKLGVSNRTEATIYWLGQKSRK